MWRSVVAGERSGGSVDRDASLPGPQLASLGLTAQESPLLGLLSAVSRPAVSFLQRWSPFPSGRSLKQDLVQTEGDFLQQLDDLLPPQQLQSLPWFNLSELGIPEDPALTRPGTADPAHTRPGTATLGSMIQTESLLSHVLLQPPQSWSQSGSQSWLGLWGGGDDERLAHVRSCLLSEKAPCGGVGTAPCGGVAKAQCGGVAKSLLLALDLDHGYCSLEEEQLLQARAQLRGAEPERAEPERGAEPEPSREEEPQAEEAEPVLRCENKAIAFIMGCPCSDDSDSDSDDEDDEEDDEEAEDEDDGFDSVCSSEISDPDSDSDPDCEDEEDEDLDPETERLWSSLCQNHDPYSPRNFTAKLCSSPRPIPGPGLRAEPGAEEVQPSPCSSLSSSSSSSSSSWDEASEAETEEALKLLRNFTSCSDPYSPLNFQAETRTKTGPRTKPGARTKPGLQPGPEEEEGERRERKISESSPRNCRATTSNKKQVRFVAEVLVFSVGCEERRGPWEEFARDRARFAKRCSDIEPTLSQCLSQEHRSRVYRTLFSQSESCSLTLFGQSESCSQTQILLGQSESCSQTQILFGQSEKTVLGQSQSCSQTLLD